MESSADRFHAFQVKLKEGGERAALEYLRSLTDFRFLALIYYEGGRGHPIHLVDRDQPEITDGDELDQRVSYCSHVVAERKPFHTANSVTDARLVEHAAREHVRAYFGVPVFTNDGTVRAVLCHFDPEPQDTGKVDLALLLQVAREMQERMTAYRFDRPVSTVSTVHTEAIGSTSLHIVVRTKEGWERPMYAIERSKIRADGSVAHRLRYGMDGFTNMEEALEFGREWCAKLQD